MKHNNIRLRRREIDKKIKLASYIPPLLHRLYVSRGVRSPVELELSIKKILPWQQLSDIEKATDILYKAFRERKRIVIIGDFDVDGATGIALSILCMKALGCNNIFYLVPNRFEEGYGLSPEIVEQSQIHGAQIIMTVDNGISCYEGINRARQLGIPVIVTDHHLPGDTLPDAEVIINPNLRNNNFPSKSLAGVGVAFYLMLALRTYLNNKGWFKELGINAPNLAEYLDLVALGTVIDVVPLDTNNRILIWQGLNRIRAGKCRPGIKALIEVANRNPHNLVASDLGFAIGPRLNAAGRLDDMSVSVMLLLCENISKAKELAYELDKLNRIRKEIEQEMQLEALAICDALKQNKTELPYGLAIYHPKWHQGVIGILASRIKEQFYRPVIAFAPTGKEGILKGSGRSIQELHMRDVLNNLDILYPGLILSFGGHAMAAGLLIEEKRFKEFQCVFNKLIVSLLGASVLQDEIISDGPLMPNEMTVEVAEMLRDAGPWGQMFPEPIFDGRFYLLQQKLVGKRHLKVTVKPVYGGPILDGIVFNIDTTCWPDKSVYEVELVYKLDINEFCGKCNLQIIINNIWPI